MSNQKGKGVISNTNNTSTPNLNDNSLNPSYENPILTPRPAKFQKTQIPALTIPQPYSFIQYSSDGATGTSYSHHGMDSSPSEEMIIARSNNCINDFHIANQPSANKPASSLSTTTTRNQQRPRKWSPPASDCYKVNSDANLQVTGWWGLGAVVRDSAGLAMASASWRMKGSEDVKLAEAFALFRSTDLAIACGFRKVVFEVDSEQLVFAVVFNF